MTGWKLRRGPHRVSAAVLALCALAVAGCSKDDAPAAQQAGARAYRVTAVTVAARPLTYAVEAIGSLEAYQVVTVPARVEGTIEKLSFDEGTPVTPDTVLCIVDERRHTLLLDQAKGALAQAEAAVEQAKAGESRAAAQVARARAEFDEAQADAARWKALRAKDVGYVSEEKILEVEARAKSLEAQVEEAAAGEKDAAANMRAALAAVDARKAEVALAQKNLDDASVRSPIGGIVEAKHVAAGQYVKVGDKVATLVDTSRLRLRFSVGESESVKMRKGQEVRFRVQGFQDRDFEAELFHVSETADPTTRMVECLAEVKDHAPGLPPGFFAQVRVEMSRAEGAIVVPEGALLPTEKGFVAFVVEKGRAVQRPLELGLHTKDGGVEVLSGLKAGETLVVDGAQSLQDGVPVQVVDEAAKQ